MEWLEAGGAGIRTELRRYYKESFTGKMETMAKNIFKGERT
jgi:hypothetical protein